MPVVELAGVTKTYENKVAVHNLSFSIEAGQMFGLLGPNGAGKTSSIRMMMGITLPDSGTVTLFDRPFDRVVSRSRPEWSVLNLRAAARLRCAPSGFGSQRPDTRLAAAVPDSPAPSRMPGGGPPGSLFSSSLHLLKSMSQSPLRVS